MLIRNPEKTLKILTCYKVNKTIASHLISHGIKLFAMDENDLGKYYFIKDADSEKIINNLPLYLNFLGKYEIVGREVNKNG